MRIQEWSTDCYGCEADLNDADGIEQALRRGADAVSATVLGQSCTQYQPIGVTVFLPLAESHLMVSTWPEHRYAIVSILLCNAGMDPALVLDEVLKQLRPSRARTHRVPHEIAPASEHAEALSLQS